MKLSLCTISFRHHLTSMTDLACWAQARHFDSLELWGVHARHLMDQRHYNRDWLAGFGLNVSMVSDYFPLLAEPCAIAHKVELMCQLACHWGSRKLRTFAGDVGSVDVDTATRQRMVANLRQMADICAQAGVTLVVETHPGTLADNLVSTRQLLEEVSSPNLKINFDVLHVWESGVNPIEAFDRLQSDIVHLHLKNIDRAEHLGVFAPANVYSPAGERAGMVPLFEGVVDYAGFLAHIRQRYPGRYSELDASLEWFGSDCWQTLNDDRYRLQQFAQHAPTAAV